MAAISVKGGNSQVILDGSQNTLSLLAITTGTGVVHVGDPSPLGFDVPFDSQDRMVLPANLAATLRADGFVVTGSIGAYGGQVYDAGGNLPDDEAIVEDGMIAEILHATGNDVLLSANVEVAENAAIFRAAPSVGIVATGAITLLPATGTTPAQGAASASIVNNVASYRMEATRVALTTGATAPVQNSAGAAIGTGTITIGANAVTHIRLPATVAGVSNSGAVQVRNSAGADAHAATAVVAAGALTGVNLAATVALVDDGETFAVDGGTVTISVAAGVASATFAPTP